MTHIDLLNHYYSIRKEIAEEKKKDELSKRQCEILNAGYCRDLIGREGKCRKCKRTDKLTIDHVIPKFLLQSFGFDLEREFWPENFIVLCRPCNIFKSARLDFTIPETKPLLLKLLERV